MNYTDTGARVFKRSRSREAEQAHEPQRERDTFNNDRKKKGNVSKLVTLAVLELCIQSQVPCLYGERSQRRGYDGYVGLQTIRDSWILLARSVLPTNGSRVHS